MRWPSLGFVWMTGVVVLAVGFFSWGVSTPPLESAWRMTIDLGAGSRGRLNKDERGQLARTLRRHPTLAEDIVEDSFGGIFSVNDRGRVTKKYAYLVRLDASDPRVVVSYDGVRNEGAVKIRARVGNDVREGEVEPSAPFEWTIPDGPYPQLVELRFPGMKKKDAVQIVRGAAP